LKIKSKKYNLCIIGTFPPPIHGLALVNKAMKEEFVKAGLNPLVLNINCNGLNRSIINIFYRFIKVVLTFPRFSYQILVHRIKYLYIGLSGGFGQVYDLIFIFIGALLRLKIYIHHHSFAYLNKWSILTKLIVWISKNSADHIVLCDYMKTKLARYNKNITIHILSNAVFVDSSDVKTFEIKDKFPVIGFFSNISFDKGIKEYFEVIEALINNGYKIKGLIAGSISDEITKTYVDSKLSVLKGIQYLGQIENKEKLNFLNKMDILLMPTKYKNEAEPLVIHEAMSHGIAVIAWDRGCISNIILPATGVVIDKENQYVSSAVNNIVDWIINPNKLILTRKLSYKQFNSKKFVNMEQLKSIINGVSNS